MSDRRNPAQWTLVYDGDCAFCMGWVRRVQGWDRERRLAYVPLQDDAALAVLPFIAPEALLEAMHVISPEGAIYKGAAAGPPILRLLPGRRWIAPLLAAPLVRTIAGVVYRWVARHRHQLPGATDACDIGNRGALTGVAQAPQTPQAPFSQKSSRS